MDHLLEYAPLVRAMARRYLGPGLEREDLEQEAWLALVAARAQYRPELGPRPAYYKSRVRAALAQALRRFRRDALFYKAPLEGDIPLAAGEELDGLWQWTWSLTPRQRQVLDLYFGRDLTLSDIARRLGISLSAVSTHKQRGLAALARRMSCGKKGSQSAPGISEGR